MVDFACDMAALSQAERTRHFWVIDELPHYLQVVEELQAGYALRFPPESSLLALLAEFVDGERRCCPFIAFVVKIEANGGPLWLEMTGEQGVKPFLVMELNLAPLLQGKSRRSSE